MKRVTVGLLIAAVIMILLGTVVGFFGLLSLGLDGDGYGGGYQMREYTVEEPFRHIVVDGALCQVILTRSGDDKCHVICLEKDKITHEVVVKGDILTITELDTRKWHDHIGIYWEEMTMEIALPETEYDSFAMQSDVGGVEVPADFTLGDCRVETDTGRVTILADVTMALTVKNDTGRIAVTGTQAGTINLENDTGKILLTDVTTGSLQVENDTGSIDLERVTVQGEAKIENDTGAIRLKESDAGAFYMENDTGSVTGTLLSPKRFMVQSDTGSVRVPSSGDGGLCQIQTDTGSIHIEIV